MEYGRGIMDHDLRNYIKRGDIVTYVSRKKAFSAQDLKARRGCRCSVPVTEVYRDFAVTRLGRCADSANRWDIEELHGRPFELYIPLINNGNIYDALSVMRCVYSTGRRRTYVNYM